MSTKDFPPRPQGAEPDSVAQLNWLDKLRDRQNIDAQQELTSVATGDEILIFDVSETGNVKTKKATVSNIAAGAGAVIGPASATDSNVALFDGTTGKLLKDGYPVRTKLSANRTYYVRTDGSDSNDGLANTAGGAFLTIQKAINTLLTLDLGGFTGTIQVGSGTYTGTISITSPFVGGNVTLTGDTTTPSNVIISTSSTAINVNGTGVRLTLEGFKVTASSGHCVLAQRNAQLFITNDMEYGAAGTGLSHIVANDGGQIIISPNANYTVSGAAAAHYYLDRMSLITASTLTVTVSGTPAFSTAFANCLNISTLYLVSVTMSGSATGTRYTVNTNSVANTGGGGANYFPGNVAGSTATGGQYV